MTKYNRGVYSPYNYKRRFGIRQRIEFVITKKTMSLHILISHVFIEVERVQVFLYEDL